jgi:phosphatidylglycerophosphate synthase
MISRRKGKLSKFLLPFTKLLQKTHLSPNGVTVLGFLTSLLVIPFLVFFVNYTIATLVILFAGFFDALDGAYARATNRVTERGGFIDSVLDRYSDVVIIVTIIFAGLCSVVWGVVALVGFLLVSYSRARAEAFHIKHFLVGFAERPVRLLLLALALLLENWYPGTVNYMIIALAIMTHLTVLQRAIYAKDALTKDAKKSGQRKHAYDGQLVSQRAK